VTEIEPTTEQRHYLACPSCGDAHAFTVTHLVTGQTTGRWGPWYCDQCGQAIVGEGMQFEVSPGNRSERRAVLLRHGDVHIVVEGARYHKPGKPIDERQERDGMAYLYNEHTCPTNFLRVEAIISADGDSDPHGIFEYVDDIPWPEGVRTRREAQPGFSDLPGAKVLAMFHEHRSFASDHDVPEVKFGRVVRDEDGKVVRIEHLTAEEFRAKDDQERGRG
jgi:ribosomal protein L37AE/L43A